MTSKTLSLVSGLETFEEIYSFMKSDKCTPAAIYSRFHGKYGPIKAINHLLPIIADLENLENSIPLEALKEGTLILKEITLKPLIEKASPSQNLPTTVDQPNDLVNEHAEVLVKWWISYISILDEALNVHEWTNKTHIFDESDFDLLVKTFKLLKGGNHLWWGMALTRAICSKEDFFRNMVHSGELRSELLFNFDDLFEELKTFEKSFLKREIDELVSKDSKDDHTRSLRKNLLKTIFNQLNSNDSELSRASLLSGFFDKKKIPSLEHSVLIGYDGGHYALINSISEEERLLIIKTNFIKEEYLERISSIHPRDPLKSRLIIGQGSFGKIRLCLALTSNQTCEVMRPGLIACCKKTAFINKKVKNKHVLLCDIRKNCWNDYLVVEIGHLIHSPDIYDFHIIENLQGVDNSHYKGFTIQKYLPVLDGSKAFTKKNKKTPQGPFYKQWVHQRAYFIDIFQGMINLLRNGVCMTDLKPANTLYNAENYSGTLIDLSGVISKKSIELLKTTKVHEVKELTEDFTAPELMYFLEDEMLDESIDLCKCMTYSMGKMIEETDFDEIISQDLEPLIDQMLVEDPKNRLSMEESFEKFQKIHPAKPNLDIDFKTFMNKLKGNTFKTLSDFGFNENIKKVEESYINQKVSLIDVDRYNIQNPELFDLKNELDEFISKNQTEKTFVLLGSSGSGKSTILQLQYLDALDNWKDGHPIPIFINLSIDSDLKNRWKNLCTQLGYLGSDSICNFNVFSILEYPVTLYVDSFDEAVIKINYISDFHEVLGSNQKIKILICCRSEFIQTDLDFKRFFTRPHQDINESLKRFIVSLTKTKFELTSTFISDFYEKWFQSTIKCEEILIKIKEEGIMEMLTTGYMVHLTLTVLPELLKDLELLPPEKRLFERISKIKVYKKYIINFLKKIEKQKKEFIFKEFATEEELKEISADDYWIRFAKRAGMLLARTIHEKDSGSKVSKEQAIDFLKKYRYDTQIQCLNNIVLAIVIRGLDLTLDIKKKVPNEAITLGFSHDTIKNYFLTEAIKEDCKQIMYENKESNLLGLRLIVDDVVLIRFLSESMKEDLEFQELLKQIVYKTKEEKTSDNICIAASNAITVLIAGNISFSNQDLSKIKIRGACLRDGMFCGTDFSEADLTGSILESCKLDGALFYKTNLTDIKLGILPDINVKSAVYSCCFNPKDGNEILCGCDDGTLQLWDRLGGKLIKTFQDNSKKVNSVAFSSNGQLIASGSCDKTIKLWDKTTRNLLKTFQGHSGWVNSVAFSPGGQVIVSGSDDKTIKLWDRTTGNLLNTFKGHSNSVYSVVFSPDEQLIMSGSRDKTIKLWDRITGNLLKTFLGHSNCVISVAFSPKEHLIASGSRDETIKLWDITTGNLIKTFQGHSDMVISVAFSPDGQLIASGSRDETTKLWDRTTGNLLKTFQGHSDMVNSVAFSPDGQLIASGSSDKTIKLCDITTGNLLKEFQGHSIWVNSVAFAPDGQLLASGSADKTIKLWDSTTGNLLKTFQGHSDVVNSVAFSPNKQLIASGSWDKTIKLWDGTSGNLLKTFQGHSNVVSSVAFSPDEQLIASGSHDQTIKLWDRTTGNLLKTFQGHSNVVNSVAFSSDVQLILSGSRDQTIKLWDRSTGNVIKIFQGHSDGVNSVAFTPHGLLIASGSRDKTIKLWDGTSGNLLKTFQGHSDVVNSVVFSPTGQLIASGSHDQTIKLWDRTTGNLIKTFQGHSGIVISVAFSPDGQLIASGSGDLTIKLWDRTTINLLKTFKVKTKVENSVAFSPDGQLVASGFDDETLKIWNRTTGNLLKTFSRDQCCIGLLRLFNKLQSNSEYLDYSNFFTISLDYSSLTCHGSLFINCFGLSSSNEQCFIQKYPFFFQDKYDSKINSSQLSLHKNEDNCHSII